MFASLRPLARTARRAAPLARSYTTARPGPRFAAGAAGVAGAVLLAGSVSLLTQRAEADADADPHRAISLAELEKHWTQSSIWVAIDGRVYDVTSFLLNHPGGDRILIDNAGKDMTKMFHAIHKPTTLAKYVADGEVKLIGILDAAAMSTLAAVKSDEEERIIEARKKLFGVDSVVSLSDFERYAKDLLPLTAWAYYCTGADTEAAFRENSNIFKRVWFRPRIMRDVREIDTSQTILGVDSSLPIYVCPTARNGLGNPEGEAAVARGAGNQGIFQVLSHYASRSLDEVKAAAKEGQQIGWQCYLQPDRKKSEEAIKEAVKSGAHSIWITADTTILGKRATERRLVAEANPTPASQPLTREDANYAFSIHEPNMQWSDIAFVRKHAPGLPIVVKGVGAWEDAVLAYKNGADAIVLSNHGGRQLDFAQPALKTLYDVRRHAPQVLGRKNFGVFLDGGVRDGTDVLKALCLGATAVGLGRPVIYAVTGWGSDGVERLFQILREEMVIGMRLLGVNRLDQLGPEYLDLSQI